MKLFPIKMLAFVLILVNIGCDTTKKTSQSADCRTVGTVKDFTGLDGCTMLILLDDGTKLLPGKIIDANFRLKDGQRIAFDYREDKASAMTICMAEDMIVEITCIKSLDKKASDRDVPQCINTSDPTNVNWMKRLIETQQPLRISKYPYGKKFVYFFQGKTDSYAYDCEGKLICDMPNNEKNVCYDQMQTFTDGRVIYLGENPRD